MKQRRKVARSQLSKLCSQSESNGEPYNSLDGAPRYTSQQLCAPDGSLERPPAKTLSKQYSVDVEAPLRLSTDALLKNESSEETSNECGYGIVARNDTIENSKLQPTRKFKDMFLRNAESLRSHGSSSAGSDARRYTSSTVLFRRGSAHSEGSEGAAEQITPQEIPVCTSAGRTRTEDSSSTGAGHKPITYMDSVTSDQSSTCVLAATGCGTVTSPKAVSFRLIAEESAVDNGLDPWVPVFRTLDDKPSVDKQRVPIPLKLSRSCKK